MELKPQILGGLLLPLMLVGCANVAEKLRSQPAVHFKAQGAAVAPATGDKKALALHCMETRSVEDGKPHGGNSECVYASTNFADVAAISGRDPEGEKALDTLLAVSDMNCSNYMHRVFSNRTLTDFTGRLAGDLLTSTATAATQVDPNTAAALGVANLVVGKSIEGFNATYFQEKTFQALEAAINGERERIRAIILAKRIQGRQKGAGGTPVQPYGPLEALSDLRAYDDACSFKAGLNVLVSLAEQEQAQRMHQVMRLSLAADQGAEARCQYGVAAANDACTAGDGAPVRPAGNMPPPPAREPALYSGDRSRRP
ncbi:MULTISPECIES: hypothetical protein [unclassified Arenimonas]|uniref:hypothetical protein n=1 Tax=unclassified Arenimonas TaxID=2641713 RepID=UPI00086A4A38|nr:MULTISPECIES: hypothetical protein [unclassified Arenimonas]ODS64912.1 MAG: hypothetical protein ABS41_00440 [Arenimonas sp. SCN 70-307]